MQQPSWRISIQARAKTFSFKLKANTIYPANWKFHRFFVLLRLHKLNLKLQLKSGSTVSISTKQEQTIKSKFLGFLGKFRFRNSNKATFQQYPDLESVLNRLKRFSNENSIWGSGLVLVIIESVFESIFRKDLEGIITYALIILIISTLHIKRFFKGNFSIIWVVLIVGTAVFRIYKGLQSSWHGGALLILLSIGGAAIRVIFAILKLLFPHFSKIRD